MRLILEKYNQFKNKHLNFLVYLNLAIFSMEINFISIMERYFNTLNSLEIGIFTGILICTVYTICFFSNMIKKILQLESNEAK